MVFTYSVFIIAGIRKHKYHWLQVLSVLVTM